MTANLQNTLSAIDAANAHDPDTSEGTPAAQLYGERMSAELQLLYPDAPDVLQIAARGQHIERWMLPRSDFPMDRTGYLTWRKKQGRRHGARVAEIMAANGYAQPDADQAAAMLRKEAIKRDPLTQSLEDVACFTFIRWYLGPFAGTQDPEKLDRIVAKTARKMSSKARARALQEFEIPASLAAHFQN